MGTRITGGGVEKVYAAAEKWVERALRADDSLFTPGMAIWSSRWLGELHERFLNHPDESSDSFLEKLQQQLANSPPEVYQLMGEVLYLYFLIVTTKNSADEQRVIDTVLGWSPSPVEIPQELVASLTPGIASTGQYFHTSRPFQVGFLIEFVEQWKEKGLDEQHRLLANPWEFKGFVTRLNFRSTLLQGYPNRPSPQREALLHLIFPDTFEAIVSVDHKRRIARTFAKLVTAPEEDVDVRLEQIRPGLEAQYGSSNYLFYKPEIRTQWDPPTTGNGNLWDEFVRRAREHVDIGRLESEVPYKIEIGRRLAQAREAVLGRVDEWGRMVNAGMTNSMNNLIHYIQISKFHGWMNESSDDALIALQALWTQDDVSVAERVSDFADLFPSSVARGAGTRANVASVLLMGLDVEQYPPFRVTVFNQAYERTGYDQPEQDADEAALYEHALSFLDRFIEEAQTRGLSMRHRLDAQSLVWATQNKDGRIPEIEDPTRCPTDPWTPPNMEALSRELLWETGELQKIVHGLKDKRQVIFQGPPGTGKTYVAKRIAEWCREHGGDFQIVQFHPSYSYEDFVEGFRPTLTDGGQAGFKLTKGPLRRIAEKAEGNPDATFILVIDEINRGNVAKVLGELYFLLEYRDEKVGLQYSNEQFSLPRNLWFIGTMNTTDRSIALVDAALRRRFYFFGFFPDELPVKGLLDRWLKENNPEAKWVADLVDLANRKLGDRHLGIGPSHFMKKDPRLDENRVRFIWEQAIIPYIEEQCFGNEEKLKEFAYDRLKRELDGTALKPDAGSGQPEGAVDEGNGQPENGGDGASA